MDKLRDDTLLKRELVSRYILPALGLLLPTDAPLTVDIATCCRRIAVRRYEVLATPGHWHQGYAYWFEHALAHSYYLEEPSDRQPLELLTSSKPFLDAEAVLYREERYAYLQALESGVGLRITYPSIRALMAKHPELRTAVQQFGRLQDEAFRALDHYHRLSAHERIDRFADRFGTLLHRLTLDIQLLHIRVNDDLFRNYMRAKGRRYTSLRLHKRAMNTPNGGG